MTVTDLAQTSRIPASLLPADGRFGCGPSRIRDAQIEDLVAASRTLLGTSHRQKPVKALVGSVREQVAALDQLLTPQVKLFAFTHVSNTLGVINPAAELCAAAKAIGALTVVDAAQSAGHMPLDVRAMMKTHVALVLAARKKA